MNGDQPDGSDRIEVFQEHPTLTLAAERVQRIVEIVAREEGFDIAQLNVILADHQSIHDLNREWLGHDYQTDVVSFPFSDPEDAKSGLEGEVYVDLDMASERAPEFNTTFEREALRYVVHGVLHLMGFEDATEEQRQEMRAKEDRYLAVE